MKTMHDKSTPAEGERGTASMVAVISLFAVAMGFVLVSLTTSKVNHDHTSDMREQTESHFVASAGLNTAIYEVLNANNDPQADDGDGHFGALGGGGAPVAIMGQNNRRIGEYKTYLINTAGVTAEDLSDYDPQAEPPFYEVRVLAAVPSFANPVRTYMMQASLGSNAQFLFQPKSGAVSISGPVNHMSLSDWGDASFSVTGGTFPAFVFTDSASLAEAIDEIGDEVNAGRLTFPITEVTGTPEIEYDHHEYPTSGGNSGTLEEFDLSAIHEPGATFTAQMMNDYRDALRTYAEGLTNTSTTGSGSAETSQTNYTGLQADGTMTNSNGDTVIVLHEVAGPISGLVSGGAVKDAGSHPATALAGTTFDQVTSNMTFGDLNYLSGGSTAPIQSAIVLLDTSEFGYRDGGSVGSSTPGSTSDLDVDGKENLTDTDAGTSNNRLIKGNGTLVILHPVGSDSDGSAANIFDLDWQGDVFIVGYPKDNSADHGNNDRTGNLLYLRNSKWNIQGNLIAVTAGNTEASLEMRGSASSGNGLAELNVTGALMMFAEATGQESEIDIEGNAHLNVDGIAGMFGSRIELEDQNDTNTQIHVDGTFIMGLPAGNTRNDDFYWYTNGSTQFSYNDTKAQSAGEGLAELQSNLVFSSNNLSSLQFNALRVTNLTDPEVWTLWTTQLATLEAGNIARGVDLTLFD